jgi:hypothetical protein
MPPQNQSRRAWRQLAVRLACAVQLLPVVAMLALSMAPRASAAGGIAEITSDGPLDRILITGDLGCQVAHRDDESFEFFGGENGACGTFLAFDGTLYAPEFIPAGSFGTYTVWTPGSQSPVTGNGTRGDPFRLVTSVTAADTGVRVEQTDSYVIGDESYRTDVAITNGGPNPVSGNLYRAGDCYLQETDIGFGRVDDGEPACVVSQDADARIEQWVPLTDGSRYMEDSFGAVWAAVGAQEPFPNTCLCDQIADNGAGLSWGVNLAPGATATFSHQTFLAPEGRAAAGVSLRDSVPGPGQINLDPIVIASSLAIAAGIVLVVPFPGALFNSTLEEHYTEVMGVVTPVAAGTRRLSAAAIGGIGRRIRTRTARATAADDPGPPAETADATSEPARPFWTTLRGVATFVLLSAVIYAFLDPTIGLDLDTLATIAGLALSLAAMLLAFAIPLWILARGQGIGLSAEALPGTLIVAVICVVLSRVVDFQPGYVYGLIIGFSFTREVSKVESGRFEAIATGVALAVALVSWVALPAVRAGDAGFMTTMLETALAGLVVAGLEAALFGMLPLRFLPGERVRAWNPRVWAGILGVATFAFAHILLNPSSGYLADDTRTSFFTVIALLVGFGVFSVLFWGFFRFRRQPMAPPPTTDPPTPPGAIGL